MNKSEMTKALIEGVKQMLKSRGSMAIEEVEILEQVVVQLEEFEKLKGSEQLQTGVKIVGFLTRFLLNPSVKEGISDLAHGVSHLIDKLI